MQLDNLKRVCLLLTAINGLVNDIVNAETFTIGYITGSKRRPGNFEYQRPGFRISGAINLAVREVRIFFFFLFLPLKYKYNAFYKKKKVLVDFFFFFF